ncbi:MAG: toxin ParE1 [Nitrospirales bacterium]|nr:MAG: toxin ParE1 [Nitrospirales bacterium]
MAKFVQRYELSPEADSDLEELFDYTDQEFGLEQAVEYVSGFDIVFDQLIKNPELGKMRKDIRKGLRSLVHKKHVIFYRILNDRIRIVRILHGSRDVYKFFA